MKAQGSHALSLVQFIAVAAACLALSIVIWTGLDRFPGLHADEAWFGLAALQLAARGIDSTSGMTWYTGNLFPVALAAVFNLFGANVFELRALGAALNSAALFVVALALARSFGFRATWFFLCLFGASFYGLWQSRIAWEVTALTLPLLALILACLLPARAMDGAPAFNRGRIVDLALPALFWLGVVSHLIFALAALAFAGAAVGTALRHPQRRHAELVLLMGCILAMIPLVYLRNIAFFHMLPAWQASLLLLLVPPVAAAGLYNSLRRPGAAFIERCLKRILDWSSRSPIVQNRRLRQALIALLALPSLVIHGPALVDVLSGLGSIQRIASITPGAPMTAGLLALGLGLLAALIAGMVLAWRRFGNQNASMTLLILAALLSFLFMPAFVLGNSLRYYATPYTLLLISGAVSWSLLLAQRQRWLAVATAVPALIVCTFALNEALEPQTRPPLGFRIGLMWETSAHFLPHGPLIEALRASRGCKLQDPSYFIEQTAGFVHATTPWPCDAETICRAEYCLATSEECSAETGYFHVSCSVQGTPNQTP